MFIYPQRIQNFFQGGDTNFDIFSSLFFSGKIILKLTENKKGSRGSESKLPRKIFENLHIVVAILVLV